MSSRRGLTNSKTRIAVQSNGPQDQVKIYYISNPLSRLHIQVASKDDGWNKVVIVIMREFRLRNEEVYMLYHVGGRLSFSLKFRPSDPTKLKLDARVSDYIFHRAYVYESLYEYSR